MIVSLIPLALALLALAVNAQSSISFDLPALGASSAPSPNRRCFALYIGKDVMTTGKYTTTANSGSQLNFEIVDAEGSKYNVRPAAKEEEKFSFTSHAYTDYQFCFSNILNAGVYPDPSFTRTISLTINIGADVAKDDPLLSKETLKPVEVELKVLEKVMEGVVDEMEYLKEREIQMRNTNESTNSRVQWFSMLSTIVLISSGVWQVYYLRSFFQSKKIL